MTALTPGRVGSRPLVVAVFILGAAALTAAQTSAPPLAVPPAQVEMTLGWPEVLQAFGRLSLAAFLASILALRPRRLGTPVRTPAVIHTQILIAVVGALVMLVVGSSLARAFGIVGAAGLVRYRAKIEDPKDAGVMLSTLAVGLATGVGLWPIAIMGAAFLLVLLWVVETFEPKATRTFVLKVKSKDPSDLRPGIEAFLRRQRSAYDLRGVAAEEVVYEIQWPLDRPTERISERICELAPDGGIEVALEQKKDK